MPIADPWGHNKTQSTKELRDLSLLVSTMISNLAVKVLPFYALQSPTCFFCNKIPSISIGDYISRLVKYAELSETELIGALIIIDRYLAHPNQSSTNQSLNLLNVHNLVGVAIVVAQKNFSDEPYTMADYARITGLPLALLIHLEANLLSSIDFNLFTTAKNFLVYKQFIVNYARKLEASAFGPFDIFITTEEELLLDGEQLYRTSNTSSNLIKAALNNTDASVSRTHHLSNESMATETMTRYSPRFLKSDNSCKGTQSKAVEKPVDSPDKLSKKLAERATNDTPIMNFMAQEAFETDTEATLSVLCRK